MKKSVQFEVMEKIEVREVECYKSLDTIWWTKDEIREIEDESEVLLHFMNNNDTSTSPVEIDLNIHSIRGLEKRTEIGAWEMYETQRDAKHAVLNQQDKYHKLFRQSMSLSKRQGLVLNSQQLNDMIEAIAKAYRTATLKARRAAYEVGIKDQIEAKRDLSNVHSDRPRPLPLPRQPSKIVLITAEPISPTWGRRTSKPLMESSKYSSTSCEGTKQSTDAGLPRRSSLMNRTGPAPRLRSSLSPQKKRRNKSDSQISVPKKVLDNFLNLDDNCPKTMDNKSIQCCEEKSKSIQHELSNSSDKSILETLPHMNGESTIQSKLSESFVGPNSEQTEPKMKSSKEPLKEANKGVSRRRKTLKKMNDSVVLNPDVVEKLNSNQTIAVTTKRKKLKAKKKSTDDRNLIQRTTSYDSSKGYRTTDTELMLDNSNSSLETTSSSFRCVEFDIDNEMQTLCTI
jgi:hypothetical protein